MTKEMTRLAACKMSLIVVKVKLASNPLYVHWKRLNSKSLKVSANDCANEVNLSCVQSY